MYKRQGYKVTAVDYTQEMLDTAKRNAGNLCERISFYKMDAQNLEFEDDVFDVVISRNLTWNLKDPKRAYEELSLIHISSFFLSTWTCYFFSPTGIIAYADYEINMQVILKQIKKSKLSLWFMPRFSKNGSVDRFIVFSRYTSCLLYTSSKYNV